MKLNEITSVRTGAVIGRIRVEPKLKPKFCYKMLNLKCVSQGDYIDTAYIENCFTKEELKNVFFTKMGDVLIRLSSPYTSVIIDDEKNCGLLVPSHYAIIRSDESKVIPEYVLWFLNRENTFQAIIQNSSGSSAFGTISSGFIGDLKINVIPLEKQKIIGQLFTLSNKEQRLLNQLSKEKAKYNKERINEIYKKIKGRK